jgi:hypothetical protein
MPFFGVPIRNGLPIGLGSSAGFGVQPFDPSYLFAAGEQGAWYDPSDFSTLFEDSAGTTPVTGVEQFVGLMLDKSGRGNHAFQTSSAKRPKLAARYNLLTYSEEFDNAAWTKNQLNTTGTPPWVNVAVAPDGTTTAEFLIPNTSSTNHFIGRSSVTGATGIAYRALIFAKAGGYDYAGLSDNTTGQAVFNLQTGAIVSQDAGIVAETPVDVGNGWWRLAITFTASTNRGIGVDVWNNATKTTFAGDGTSGIYIWGADLRPASQATGLIGPTYQRVAAATVYDTAGFLPYLQFDGLSWSMSTNSIDFSAGDKMTVFAGVRKLSDASATNYQTTVELSASAGISNGSFAEYSSGNVNGELGFYLRGTATVGFEPTTYNAPITLVTATSYDISQLVVAAEIKPRINGVLNQTGASGTDAGTGNFGNYPLFLGARNNSAGFLNGNLYSLIVRGAQSTQSQIEATEAWVNGRTGAF